MIARDAFLFEVGDRVKKYTGDFKFTGTVRACYTTKAGFARYVIEPDAIPLQLIYSADQLRIVEKGEVEVP